MAFKVGTRTIPSFVCMYPIHGSNPTNKTQRQQVGDYEDAIAEFQHRIDMGGWYEERFQSMLDQGRALIHLGRDPSERFKAAFDLCPWRAEPLYELSLWHDKEEKKCAGDEPWLSICRTQHRAAGYFLAKRAGDLPLPTQDRLFVWHDVYDHGSMLWTGVHAYYLADAAASAFDVGYKTAKKLHARFPNQAPHEQNLAVFGKLRAQIYNLEQPSAGQAGSEVDA